MNKIVAVRGGGDLATGTIACLHRCGFQVLILESEKPTAIRRQVAFCEAVYEGTSQVEGLVCRRIGKVKECAAIWGKGEIPLLVDPQGISLQELQPEVVVDAILAKRNLGTHRGMASLTIGLGPGFMAGRDVDYVVETKRGHDLGRIIKEGSAIPNTGVPGNVGGYARERVIHAGRAGRIALKAQIGDLVTKGQTLALIEDSPVEATLDGVLRGIIRDGFLVFQGMKIADIDPRVDEKKNCATISDKARCIAGSVLEIIVREER